MPKERYYLYKVRQAGIGPTTGMVRARTPDEARRKVERDENRNSLLGGFINKHFPTGRRIDIERPSKPGEWKRYEGRLK
jgi:hypothetical protein